MDARGVDFSDSIGGTRRSYRTRSLWRRRKRLQENGAEELGDLSDSEDETLSRKLARLKREAEEVRLELERREQQQEQDKEREGKGDSEDRNDATGTSKDAVEQRHGSEDDEGANVGDVEQLSMLLDNLSSKARSKANGTLEDDFLSTLDTHSRQRQRYTMHPPNPEQQDKDSQPPTVSSLPAVAAFSDRLNALEAALGISSISADSQKTSVLPTLEVLSRQINTLSSALALQDSQSAATAAAASTAPPHTTPLLDSVSSKLKTLIAEADRLTNARKQAMQSLSDLHEARMRQLVSATVHSNTRPRRGLSNASAANPAVADLAGPGDESLQIQSRLFLDEQSSKITALYQLLPSIQNLQPLLPVVLERLRTLSVIHAGAAEAKNSLDAVEKRQAEMRDEINQWREAVESVEKGMSELEETMKGNVKVVGEMVSGLERRVGGLEQGR